MCVCSTDEGWQYYYCSIQLTLIRVSEPLSTQALFVLRQMGSKWLPSGLDKGWRVVKEIYPKKKSQVLAAACLNLKWIRYCTALSEYQVGTLKKLIIGDEVMWSHQKKLYSGHKGMFLVKRNTCAGCGVELDLRWSSAPSKSDVLCYDTMTFLLGQTNLTSIGLIYQQMRPNFSLQTWAAI